MEKKPLSKTGLLAITTAKAFRQEEVATTEEAAAEDHPLTEVEAEVFPLTEVAVEVEEAFHLQVMAIAETCQILGQDLHTPEALPLREEEEVATLQDQEAQDGPKLRMATCQHPSRPN